MSETLPPETAPDERLSRQWNARPMPWRSGGTLTVTGFSSWKRMRPSRPNTCCSRHYLDRIDPALEAGIGVYLRGIQGAHGGWPLFHDGAFDLSASVKAYFALKAIGDDPDASHMSARPAGDPCGRRRGTQQRLHPRAACPVRPGAVARGAGNAAGDHASAAVVPSHLSKVSYWSRTVIVPLLVLMALRPVARNPHNVAIQELFRMPPSAVRDWIRGPSRSAWGRFFKGINSALRVLQPRSRSATGRSAISTKAAR